MADEERKIIIDEGWKAQVQREKEQARQKAESPEAAPPQAESATEGAPVSGEPQQGEPEGEESLFMGLLTSLATQAMYALGMVAEPNQKQVMVDLGHAKFVVDTLLMLREKTEGRLTPAEQGHLSEVVGELQRIYVYRAQQVQEQALRQAGIKPGDLGKKP